MAESTSVSGFNFWVELLAESCEEKVSLFGSEFADDIEKTVPEDLTGNFTIISGDRRMTLFLRLSKLHSALRGIGISASGFEQPPETPFLITDAPNAARLYSGPVEIDLTPRARELIGRFTPKVYPVAVFSEGWFGVLNGDLQSGFCLDAFSQTGVGEVCDGSLIRYAEWEDVIIGLLTRVG